MNKIKTFYSLVIVGLTLTATYAFAQKPQSDPTKKNSDPRNYTVPVTINPAPSDDDTCPTGYTFVDGDCLPNKTGTTGTQGTNTPGNNTTGTSNTPPNVGSSVPVPGTSTTGNTPSDPNGSSTTPTNPSTTGVNGTSNVGQPNPNPNDQNNGTLPTKSQVDSATKPGDNTSGKRVSNSANSGTPPSTGSDDSSNGSPVTSPLNPGGTEVKLTKQPGQVDWTQPVGGSNAPTAPVDPNNQPIKMRDETGDTPTGSSGPHVKVGSSGPTVTGTQTASSEVKPCDDVGLKAVYRIMGEDKNNALAKMYELTTMKLARKAIAEGSRTLEGYTRKKIADLQKELESEKSSGDIQNQVKAAYENYGKSSDLTKVNADIDKALAKGKKACYLSGEGHMWNSDVSATVLAMSIGDPKGSGLTDADAAIIWAVDKIRVGAGYKNGVSANGNLMNISNRVARYLGMIQGGQTNDVASMDAKIASQQAELESIMNGAFVKARVELHDCIAKEHPDCSECQTSALAKLDDHFGLDKIQRGLASEINKSSNESIAGSMKGKIGDINFDFAKTLAKGGATGAGLKLDKFDACGVPKPAVVPGTGKDDKIYSGGTLPEVVITASKTPEYGKNYIAVQDKTYVAPSAAASFAQGGGILASKVASKKEMLSGLGPQACVKSQGCFDSTKTPACQVCPNWGHASATGTQKTEPKSGYKVSANVNPWALTTGGVLPLVTTSFMDPSVHPTAYKLDQLTPVPLGSALVIGKDGLSYAVNATTGALTYIGGAIESANDAVTKQVINTAKAVERNPSSVAKVYIKTMTGWYLSPFGIGDLYQDLKDAVK